MATGRATSTSVRHTTDTVRALQRNARAANRPGRSTLSTIVDTLAPVFLVIALGWALSRSGFLSRQALHDLTRLTYWVGLPALLVERIGTASPEFAGVTDLLIVGVGATLAAALSAGVVARCLRLPVTARGTFVQGVFRGNLAFVGLPVVIYAFAGGGRAGAEDTALLLFGPLVVLYNILAVLVLRGSGDAHDRTRGWRGMVYALATNPILIACALGLAFSVSGIELATLATRTLSAIGQMALPLALLCIGGTLQSSRVRGPLPWALAGALMKVLWVPAVAAILGLVVGLSAEHMRVALILLACPTASSSYVLARQLGGDETLASSLILFSNVLAVPAMVVVLWLT